MLIAHETEEFVLEDGAANSSARGIAVQCRNLLVGGNIGIVIEEERRGVEPACAAMNIGVAVDVLVPDLVLMSMCAPAVEPCCASYIDAFTRTSSIVSGAGLGIEFPMER